MYWVWGPVLQAPAQGRPTIVGGLPSPLPRGRIPPSPRGRNSCPYLPMIPIPPLLCACPRGDGAGRSAASTPPPVPSPVISSGVIRSAHIYLIVFVVVVVVVALKISKLRTSYHQLFPPNSKNRLCRLLRMPHLNKLTNPICHQMHPGVRTEVQKGEILHRVLTTTSCHRYQDGGPGSKLKFKKVNACLL